MSTPYIDAAFATGPADHKTCLADGGEQGVSVCRIKELAAGTRSLEHLARTIVAICQYRGRKPHRHQQYCNRSSGHPIV